MPSASYRPLQPEITNCRTCGAPVFWVRASATWKWFPCDAAHVPNGNVVLIDHRTAKVMGPEEAAATAATSERTFQSHFRTCPQAAGWRRRRGVPEPRVEVPE